MARSTQATAGLATPFGGRWPELDERASSCLQNVVQLVADFLDQPVTPTATCRFEHALHNLLLRFGRTIVEWSVNQLEPEALPAHVRMGGECYRLRPKSPRRNLDSLFGPLRLWRYRYEA